MSSSSPSQNMAQPNQLDDSNDPSAMKRKRGRPRKEGHPRKERISQSEPNKSRKQSTALRSLNSDDGLVGQKVSGSFIGVFDAGYLLTVQVGSSGPILTGLVFDPHLSVPISAENDIAPHLPMLSRNSFSPPVEEGLINQGADSWPPSTGQNTGLKHHVQAKESPTTSSFTSPVQTDLQLNTMEVTPSQNSHAPQATSETMETQNILEPSKVFLEGGATGTSELSPLISSYHQQSQPMNEHIPISTGLSDVSMEPPASKPSNGYNPSVLPLVASSEVSKASSVLDPSKVPEAASNEASLDVSNDVLYYASKEAYSVVLDPSEAPAIAEKIALDEQKSSVVSSSLATEISQHQTLKNGDFSVEILFSEISSQIMEEPSEDPKVDESLGDGRSSGGSTGSGREQE